MESPRILFIDPKPQVRPQFAKSKKPYYSAPFVKYAKSLIERLTTTFKQWETVGEDVPLKVEVCFYLRKTVDAKKKGLVFPMTHKSGDVDNFLKAFLDCAQKAKLFVDDRQVVTSISRKRYHSFGAIVCEIKEEKDLYEFDSKWINFSDEEEIEAIFERIRRVRDAKRKARKNVS